MSELRRKMRVVAQFAFVTFFLLSIAQARVGMQQLPTEVAMKFDLQGQPIGWAHRDTLIALQVGMILFTGVVFGLLPGYLSKLPAALVNVPNKDYWLAPHRRRETFAEMRAYLTWIGVLTLLTLAGVFQLVVVAHQVQPPQLPTVFGLLLGLYLVTVLGACVGIFVRFRRTN